MNRKSFLSSTLLTALFMTGIACGGTEQDLVAEAEAEDALLRRTSVSADGDPCMRTDDKAGEKKGDKCCLLTDSTDCTDIKPVTTTGYYYFSH